MRSKRMFYFGLMTLLLLIGYYGWQLTARSAYESAEYAVVESDSPFEIRNYPDLEIAATSMSNEGRGEDGSFMRLFRYIQGENRSEQKISMTTPVFMEDGKDSSYGQMGFVLPKEVAQGAIPAPTGDEVTIRTRRGGRFAVIRFAGRLEGDAVQKAEEDLRRWIEKKGLSGDQNSEVAGYDPPWTPGPLRRNEVLIRVD